MIDSSSFHVRARCHARWLSAIVAVAIGLLGLAAACDDPPSIPLPQPGYDAARAPEASDLDGRSSDQP